MGKYIGGGILLAVMAVITFSFLKDAKIAVGVVCLAICLGLLFFIFGSAISDIVSRKRARKLIEAQKAQQH